MTRILVLSDTRLPTLPVGGHGLGRCSVDIANGLRARGHSVHIGFGPGSIAPDGIESMTHLSERQRAEELARLFTGGAPIWEAVVDLSHAHDLSRILPDAPVVNYMMDDECRHVPSSCVVGNAWLQRKFKGSRIVPLGVDVAHIPFNPTGGDRLLFAAKLCFEKGPDIALNVAATAGLEIDIYGTPFGASIKSAKPEITDLATFYDVLGCARAFLAPYRYDSGSRVVLEAAAAGTPVITLDWCGTCEHVLDGVSGFVCGTAGEMAEAVGVVDKLDRRQAREWVRETHSMAVMIGALNEAINAVAAGDGW